MKILLVAVNAKYIHSNLAVYSLKSYANKFHENVKVMEFTINQHVEDILRGIYKEKADVVAFSSYIWNIDMIRKVIHELRKVEPEVKIWMGGPEVSYNYRSYLEHREEIDGIVIGEGEQTFLELVDYYAGSQGNLEMIPGIAFKESAKKNKERKTKEEIIITAPRQALNMDKLKFSYQDMKDFEHKIVYYESSRGCPYSCSYCLSSIDRKVRLRDIDLVKEELQFFLDQKVSQVKFVDRTFNCNKQHAMEIWKFIKEKDNGITNFHFEISADILDEEELALLATLRPGQVQFEIGVQSTNLDTIQAIRRKMDFGKLAKNVNQIRKGGNIHQHLDLIAGLPLEDFNSFCKSFNDVYSLKPDQLQLGFLKVLKGSPMESDSEKYGIVYQDQAPYEVLYTKHINYDQMLQLKDVCEMVDVYYNSGQFLYSLCFLENFFDSPMDLFLRLGEYYEEKGLNQYSHTRIRRYEILLEFYKEAVLESRTQEEAKELLELFQEILTLDLALRDFIRSRPFFAKEAVPYQEMRSVLDSKGLNHKKCHIEKFHYDLITACDQGKPYKKTQYMIFDYENRDPLNKAARIICCEKEATF